jgi:hypothetical protein
MRSAFITAKLIAVWLFVILVNNSSVVAQSKVNGIFISLSVNSSEFTRDRKPRAAVKVTNRSGKPISLDTFDRLEFRLESKGKPFAFCRLDECFSVIVFPRGKKLANDASLTLITKLDGLYWHNLISSIEAANHPRNLFSGIPPGTYALHAELITKADNWKADEPRNFSIRSNIVSPITIPGK